MIEAVVELVPRPQLALGVELDTKRDGLAISHEFRGYTLGTQVRQVRQVRPACAAHRAAAARSRRSSLEALASGGGCKGAVIAMLAIALVACSRAETGRTAPPDDPTPQTLDEFKTAAARVLSETGVPGAGIALVQQSGVEWAGGIGYADRDARTPVTADTHFRVGSISKSFVAMGLVQLYEDGRIDLESTVEEVDPEIAIDNPWQSTDPVRIIHVLQHTAGFDDMHFKDRYVPERRAGAVARRRAGAQSRRAPRALAARHADGVLERRLRRGRRAARESRRRAVRGLHQAARSSTRSTCRRAASG